MNKPPIQNEVDAFFDRQGWNKEGLLYRESSRMVQELLGYQYRGNGRPSPHVLMMDLAFKLSERSTCSRLQVGCVITNREMTSIEGMGYNGGARKQKNECESLEPGKCGHLHAEINALIKADYSIKDKKVFVTTVPCRMCAKALVNGDIREVFFAKPYRDNSSVEILKADGISVFQIRNGRLIEW